MSWADVITDQPGACMGSQAWIKCDVTGLYAKRGVKVKCNASMHQAISTIKHITSRLCRIPEKNSGIALGN